MNVSPVVDFLSDEDLAIGLVVKKTSTGVALADAGDRVFGTNLVPTLYATVGERMASIQLPGTGICQLTLGDGTDVAVGDEVELSTNGTVIKQATGLAVGVVLEAATVVGQRFNAYLYPAPQLLHQLTIVAAGTHSWAGGAATTDSIAVVGLVSTDVVLCSLTARGASEYLVLAANDHANDQIDLTLSANGTDTTTKVNYLVLRPL